jgi:ankyrin repeat protein
MDKGHLDTCSCRDYDRVKAYLENGGDVNAMIPEITATPAHVTILCSAIIFTHPDLINLVLEAKADVNLSCSMGTPLQCAVHYRLPGVVEWLLRQNDIVVDLPNKFGVTAFQLAIATVQSDNCGQTLRQREAIIDYLREAGASLKGTTIAHWDYGTKITIGKHQKYRILHLYVCLLQRKMAKDCVRMICKMVWEMRFLA